MQLSDATFFKLLYLCVRWGKKRGAGDARASHRLQPWRWECQDESQTTVVALGMPGRVTDYSRGARDARTSHRLQSWRWECQGESQTTAKALGKPGRVTDYSRGAGEARASHRLQQWHVCVCKCVCTQKPWILCELTIRKS